MKFRTIALALSALLIVCLLSALAACGMISKAGEPLTGNYVVVDITDDPDGISFAELESMYREIGLDIQDFVYFTFYEDGWFKLVLFGDTEAEGPYTRNGRTLTLGADAADEAMTAEISGKKITWAYEGGAKLVFEEKESLNSSFKLPIPGFMGKLRDVYGFFADKIPWLAQTPNE